MNAISVEKVSKRYVIGHQGRSDTLRDALTQGVRGIWQRFRNGAASTEDFWALRDIDFSVKPGEVVGIIGRNGAGKSTLLKILSRITGPTTGRIEIQGRIASLLEVGTGFHPELSGRENIFLNGAILGMTRTEIARKFDEIVAFAEVERFLDTPVKRYSSGMYVRLAFAVAAHLEPEILIVDEVLAVGDVEFQRKCLGKMQNVSRESGRTILFVSHNFAAIRQLCERCIQLDQGVLVRDGPTADVLAPMEVGNSVEKLKVSAPFEALPGVEVLAASARCTTDPESSFSNLEIEATGRMDGRPSRYGICLQITTLNGTLVSKLGARLLKIQINGRKGAWGVRVKVPNINQQLAGGRYHVLLLVNETLTPGKPLTAEPFTIDIPVADPYGVGVSFEASSNGLMALPASVEEIV